MEKILLNVFYEDTTRKFWSDSYIKNKIFNVKKDINSTIADALYENDFMEMSYKGKPVSTMYCDTKNGETKAVGYIYRVKTEIDGKKAYFDAWVEINSVEDYKIKELI